MNFEVWPQKRMMAAASRAHQRPLARLAANPRSSRDTPRSSPSADSPGCSSRLPPKYSSEDLSHVMVFINYHPRNRRLKKNRLVGKSMQKNAQPRLTMMKVSAQAANRPKSVECRVSSEAPVLDGATPCSTLD